MSWGIQAPCWNCVKNQECKDAQHVQEGINGANQDADGHKGGGMVVMSCSRCMANS